MLRVFKSELYTAAHSRTFWLFVVAMMLVSTFTVAIGVEGHKPVEQYYFTTGGRDETLEIAIAKLMGTTENHLYYRDKESEYQLSRVAFERIEALPEYGYLLEREDFLHCQEIYPNRYDLNEANVFEKWAVTGIFSDVGGAFITALFFAFLFFGRAHAHRGYTVGVLCGVDRINIVLGRIFAYVSVGIAISAIQMSIAYAVYAPRVLDLYGWKTMALGMVSRISSDLFFYGIAAAFSVLIKNSIISFLASFGFITLFLSNRAVVELPVFDSYMNALSHIVDVNGFVVEYLHLFAWTAGVLTITSIASVVYMRRAELK
jgi:hypothetical protein